MLAQKAQEKIVDLKKDWCQSLHNPEMAEDLIRSKGHEDKKSSMLTEKKMIGLLIALGFQDQIN